MKLLQSLRINTRLIVGFVAALAFVAAGSAVGLWQLGKLERLTKVAGGQGAPALPRARVAVLPGPRLAPTDERLAA